MTGHVTIDRVQKWKNDPVIRSCGGLHTLSEDYEDDIGLIELLDQVFETNIDLLTELRPELKLDTIDLIVTAGTTCRALAYRCDRGRAIVIEVSLLRAFWTRIATIAHIPTVLSKVFPLDGVPSTAWLAADCPTVPCADDWQMRSERVDYFVDVMMLMLEYVVLHELAHHTRGHLDLMSGTPAIALIDENVARCRLPTQPAAGFALRDIEFDADAHSLDLTLCAMDAKFPFAKAWASDEAARWQFQMTFAQILVAQLFDGDGRATCDNSPDGHPASIYRSMNFANLAARTLHGLVGGKWETYRDGHDAAWYESSLVARHLDYPSRRWHNEEGIMLPIAEFAELERQYFESSERLDRLSDLEDT